jgi:hypothetical protein
MLVCPSMEWQLRIGDAPATLLRIYVQRTKKADTNAAGVLGTIAAAITRTGMEQHQSNFGSNDVAVPVCPPRESDVNG